jgi:transposase
MEVIVDRCAGLDVHKDQVTACVRGWGEGRRRRSQTRVFLTFEASLRELRDWLSAEGVSVVAMEATGVYWKPIWYMLEDAGFELLLVNPQHVKAVSGRKTDVRDAAWLGQLLECGLLTGSFVPPREVRELRDVTRYRRRLVEDRTRELLRLQKLLEDAQVKLDSVVSDISGVTARSILDALCAGERDPEALAALAVGRLKAKIPLLRQAVPGRFNAHHAVLVGELLGHLDYLRAAIGRLDAQVDELMRPFSAQRDLLMTVPGVKKTTAEIVIAEIGVDMGASPRRRNWRPGRGCALATTNRRGNAATPAPETGTRGCSQRWWRRPGRHHAPGARRSRRGSGGSRNGEAGRKQPWPWPITSWS